LVVNWEVEIANNSDSQGIEWTITIVLDSLSTVESFSLRASSMAG